MKCPVCHKADIPEEYDRCPKCKKIESISENTQGLINKDLLLDS